MGAFGLTWLIHTFVLRYHRSPELVSTAILSCIVLFQRWWLVSTGQMALFYNVVSLGTYEGGVIVLLSAESISLTSLARTNS